MGPKNTIYKLPLPLLFWCGPNTRTPQSARVRSRISDLFTDVGNKFVEGNGDRIRNHFVSPFLHGRFIDPISFFITFRMCGIETLHIKQDLVQFEREEQVVESVNDIRSAVHSRQSHQGCPPAIWSPVPKLRKDFE